MGIFKLWGLYRALLGALLLAVMWGVLTWLASNSLEVSLLATFWTLFVAPWAVPTVFWWGARVRGRIRRLNVNSHRALRDLILKSILTHPTLNFEFWVLENDMDHGFFWYEKIRFSKTRSTVSVVLSRAWLKKLEQDPASLSGEFEGLWNKIAALNLSQRRLRTLQIAMWSGSAFIFEVLFMILDALLKFLGVRNMPSSAFWCQAWAWQVASLTMGLQLKEQIPVKISQHALRVDSEPYYWGSILWGIWSVYPARVLHPSWRFLMRDEALLTV